MSEMNPLHHSPLPWFAHHKAIVKHGQLSKKLIPIGTARTVEDAEYIAVACNRYESLLRLLKRVVESDFLEQSAQNQREIEQAIIHRAESTYSASQYLQSIGEN